MLDFSIFKDTKTPVLNYTYVFFLIFVIKFWFFWFFRAFAWDNSDLKELHSENGFIVGEANSSLVAMNLVMNNGNFIKLNNF